MCCQKTIKIGMIVFLFYMNFNVVSFFENKKIENISAEKPLFFQQGQYRDGEYFQFTVDKPAFVWGSAAGVAMRTLASLAQCGTRFENFKSSVLRPGVIKSMLFWVPAVVGYRYSLVIKMNKNLQERLARYGESMVNHFSLNDQASEN